MSEQPGDRAYARTTNLVIWCSGATFAFSGAAIQVYGWNAGRVVGAALALGAFFWCLRRSDRHDEALTDGGRS